MRQCNVCLIKRKESEFSPGKTNPNHQCKSCNYVRSYLWREGITPAPNELVALMVKAFEGRK